MRIAKIFAFISCIRCLKIVSYLILFRNDQSKQTKGKKEKKGRVKLWKRVKAREGERKLNKKDGKSFFKRE